jgi:alkylation response protein AidB-like acyl-CoA dehydrogenase
VIDENVQIHGGNGYVKDYEAERYYRDSRVNRIFEGTNEINRLLIPGMLARRALKGDIALIAAARRLQDETLSPALGAQAGGGDEPLADEARAVGASKKVALMILGTAMQSLGDRLADEQEILGYAADILIDTYASDSTILRAQAFAGADPRRHDLHVATARVFVADAALRIEMGARNALAALAEGDALRTRLAALRRILKVTPVNTVALRRRLADAAVSEGKYPLSI